MVTYEFFWWICGVCHNVRFAEEMYGRGPEWGMTGEEREQHTQDTGHDDWWWLRSKT